MAEVKWTGPLVRKTFLDYFAERGHSIGKGPSRPRDATDALGIFACRSLRKSRIAIQFPWNHFMMA